jgi:DNA-binding NtrC family response regulator
MARACLIVDDNEAFAQNLAEIIEDEGLLPTVAVSAKDALTALRARRFEVMVTDLRMPSMNGARLLGEARRLDPGLPAIAVTAYADGATLAQAQHQGFLAIFDKLVPVDELVQRIRLARRSAMVAVVEDDEVLAENLSEAVSCRGFTPLRASTAADAARFDAVGMCAALVDLLLPDSPSGEVLTQLEQVFPTLPLLVMTGHGELAHKMGRRWFEKPFGITDMLDALEDVYRARNVSAA